VAPVSKVDTIFPPCGNVKHVMVFGFQNPLRDIDAFETDICETSRGERFFLGETAESNTDFVSDDTALKVPTCEYKVPIVTSKLGNSVHFLWTSFGFLH